MSTSEQHIYKNGARNAKPGYFHRGTPLVYVTQVNTRSTYREITLILGVFVALIVALTIWAAQKPNVVADQKVGNSPSMVAPVVRDFISKTITLVKL